MRSKTLHPITVVVDDFSIRVDLKERPCVCHYSITLSRQTNDDAWEMSEVDDYFLMREIPGFFLRLDPSWRRSPIKNSDLRHALLLELEAILSSEPDEWQRLQQAANEAYEKKFQ